MIKVYVPATSANIGPGFDVLGIALNTYNVFSFEKSVDWSFSGFKEEYCNEDNLVCQAALKTFEYANKQEEKLTISLLENDIPDSRGLGSSASCIVAGIIGANYFMGNILSKEDMLNIAAMIEGHPDNVAPAIYGGLVACYYDNGYKAVKYEIDNSLNFLACIPPFELNTRESRQKLPACLPYKDIVFTTSRLVNLPYAFKKGDIPFLRSILQDKMNEPYRLPLIKDSDYLVRWLEEHHLPGYISGSGPTMMIVYKEIKIDTLKLDWQFKTLKVDNLGARWEG